MIHTTIGVYPDGSFKVNGVTSEDLAAHIEYNKTFRFGRALIVDGEIVYQGYWDLNALTKMIQQKNLKAVSMKTCTAPYV